MLKNTGKISIFFVSIFLLYFLFARLSVFWNSRTQLNVDITLLVLGVGFIGGTLGLYYLLGLEKIQNTKDNFEFKLDPAKACRGGPYMWQGNSELAETCRKLNSTSEGKKDIQSYECPCPGSVGIPARHGGFQYTPQSDANWENARCNGEVTFENNGLF